MESKFTPTLLDSLLREGAAGFFESAPESILALVLTGSISRGEGTFIAYAHGGARLIGDIEFLLVSSDLNEGRRKAMELERLFSDMLKKKNIDAEVDVTAAPPTYFEGLGPHIFGVELRAHGKVIAGDLSIMERIPEFSAADIPSWDALHLLFNRMVEQMIALEGFVDGDLGALKRAHYQNIKFTLDIGGSMLASLGLYRTTYAERAEAVEEALLLIENEAIRGELSGLPRDVKNATAVKLAPGLDPVLTLPEGSFVTEEQRAGVLARWLELARMVRSLWVWEMNRYLGSAWSIDEESLLRRYCKKEKLAARLYGWSKCIGRIRRRGAVDYFRVLRLLGSGSPRGHIYASAARLYFALPGALEASGGSLSAKVISEIQRELPALADNASFEMVNWPAVCRDVVHNWNMHVKTNE
jgi:hypothetical protein